METTTLSKKNSQYTVVNLARILLIIITGIAAFFFADFHFVKASIFFLIFSLAWFFLYETGKLNLKEYPNLEMIPPAIDIGIISYMIYLTGTVNSFLVSGYFYAITISSLNTKISQGRFAFLFSSFLYTVITLGVYLNFLPAVNFLSEVANFTLTHMLLAFLLIFVSNYAVYKTVYGLAMNNNQLFHNLTFTKEKAEQANKQKNDILANMSHEIRTPLNAIIGITNHLVEENNNLELIENFKILKFSSDQLLTLINDILDLGKIDEGKLHFEQIDFEIHFLIANIIHSLSSRAKEKGIEIIFNIDKEIPSIVKGDPTRIGQIFTNLISNAIKFTTAGMVKIIGTLVKLDKDLAVIDFSVQDSGIGIPEDKLDSIFEKYTQANSETTRKYGGTGLGLTIVRQILSLMNSSIQVKSKLGEGSEFTFRLILPVAETKPANSNGKHISIKDKNLKGLSILIVEDNAVNVKVLVRFLSKWNAKIETADNGKIGFEKMAKQDFDLILMDLQMPEMDGFESTKAIRNLPEQEKREVPIIALTADAMLDVEERIIQAGMNELLTKPFQPEELYMVLKKYAKE